jgi:hypothetical protein
MIATPWPDRVRVINELATGAFTESELATANAFKLAKRRDEWLLSRLAAKQLAIARGIADDMRRVTVERPWLAIDGIATDWRVSLSHSASYAGAAIAREPVGLDVQVVRPIAEWSSHLFLGERETADMQRCAIAHRAPWKQRSDQYATMKQLPLALIEERDAGLRFDAVETCAIDDLIVAVTRPIF